MNVLDYHLAHKILTSGENEQPYSWELNKKQPHITREDRLPENIGQYPPMPEAIKPLVDAFISDLHRLREKEESIKAQEKIFKDMIAVEVGDKNQLKVSLNAQAQEVGEAIAKIEPVADEALTTFQQFIIMTQRELERKTNNTMAPGAQLEVLKNLLIQANKELAEQVISKFDQAIKQFEITTETYKRTVRVWPIPQSKMKGKAIRLAQEIEQDITHLVHAIHDLIIEGLSGLHSVVGLLHEAINKYNGSNVIKMPSREQVPLAAMKLSNARK